MRNQETPGSDIRVHYTKQYCTDSTEQPQGSIFINIQGIPFPKYVCSKVYVKITGKNKNSTKIRTILRQFYS